MRWLAKIKSKAVRIPVLTVMLGVCVLSIGVISGFNYFVFHRMNSNTYLESFVRYNKGVTDTAFKNLDSQISQSIYQLPQLYFSDIPENEPLLRLQEGNLSFQEIRDFCSEMSRIQNSYPFVYSVDIYYEGSGIAVTGFTNIHYPEDEERLGRYLPWLSLRQESEASRGFLDRPVKLYATGEQVLTYVTEISDPKWKGKSVVLAIHISFDAFGELMNEDEGELAVLARDGQILYDTAVYRYDEETEGTAPLSAAAVLAVMERDGLGKNGETFSLDLGYHHITVFCTAPMESNLWYLYRVASSHFYREYYATRRMFLISFLISIGFHILLVAWISYYYYLTYRGRLLNASREAGLALEQDRPSFDTSLNLLTREISSLHTTINSSRGHLFQGTVRALLLGKNTELTFGELAPYLEGDSVCVFLFYIPEADSGKISAEQLQEEYRPGEKDYNVLFASMERIALVAVLIGRETAMQADREAFVRDMDRRWQNCRLVSGLTCPLKNDGIKSSYKSALSAAEYRFIMAEKKWITWEELGIDDRKHKGSHLKLFEIMERDLNNENFGDYQVRLEGLAVSFKDGEYSITYCHSTLRDFVTLFYRFMQQRQLDMRVVFGYDIREYYKQISTIEMFYEWGLYLGETVINILKQQRRSVDTDMKEAIAVFVEDNLENDLTLELLADRLELRLDAASRLFRQTMGKGYTDYVREQKLKRAVELLEKGESVKDIAERLGYSSSQYFIKVFKESYGITPHQYRKRQGK